MDFAPLLEGSFAKRFIDRLGQIDAGMDDVGPWLAPGAFWGVLPFKSRVDASQGVLAPFSWTHDRVVLQQ
jgi:hypothetical protein